MSERQYDHIMKGMEFYNRFMCAQPDGTNDLWRILCDKYNGDDEVLDLFFPELVSNQTYGHSHLSVYYEIWKHMAHVKYKKQNPDQNLDNDWNVHSQDALFTSTELPMKIEFST